MENKSKLVWRNLLKYQCPDCFSQLERPGDVGPDKCTICNFKISREKLERYCDSMWASRPRRPYNEEEDNLSKLNNL